MARARGWSTSVVVLPDESRVTHGSQQRVTTGRQARLSCISNGSKRCPHRSSRGAGAVLCPLPYGTRSGCPPPNARGGIEGAVTAWACRCREAPAGTRGSRPALRQLDARQWRGVQVDDATLIFFRGARQRVVGGDASATARSRSTPRLEGHERSRAPTHVAPARRRRGLWRWRYGSLRMYAGTKRKLNAQARPHRRVACSASCQECHGRRGVIALRPGALALRHAR